MKAKQEDVIKERERQIVISKGEARLALEDEEALERNRQSKHKQVYDQKSAFCNAILLHPSFYMVEIPRRVFNDYFLLSVCQKVALSFDPNELDDEDEDDDDDNTNDEEDLPKTTTSVEDTEGKDQILLKRTLGTLLFMCMWVFLCCFCFAVI